MFFSEPLTEVRRIEMFNLYKRVLIEGLLFVVLFVFFFGVAPGNAKVVEYNLVISRQTVTITENESYGMVVNGGIPGPTLRFTEGDIALIQVHNKMDVDTSIHWHGLLVPPDMDGVPNISFPPISPGASFTYEFPIRQSGTYWYHSHTNLQEQRGVYGSIVIDPPHSRPVADREHVVLLSDWTDENPDEVLRTLKRGSEWYSIQKGSSQSIIGATRLGMLGDYLKRELQRMPAMDIADIAYDRFLANGKPESFFSAHPGETVRLRVIAGSATTYFYLEFAGGPMRIISADGLEVYPVEEQRFLIGVAETYDVLVDIPASGAYEFRATAHDGSGYASVWIGSGDRYPAPDVPKPNLYHSMGHFSMKNVFALTPPGAMGMTEAQVAAGAFDRPGMMSMGGMKEMGGMSHIRNLPEMNMEGMAQDLSEGDRHMDHNAAAEMSMDHTPPPMKMSHGDPVKASSDALRNGKKYDRDFGFMAADVSASKNLAVDGSDAERPWPPYAKLRAITPTAFSGDKPVRDIRLTLDGDMERYIWLLNNKPLSETDSILIREGEVVRFIMVNRTMMHHPMHLHGHFFRVINGQGDYAPLKHTVNVAPMSTTVIEFNANEVGDWFFHCHLLYHMKSGMARLVHYDGFPLSAQQAAVRPNLYKDSWYMWGQANILSNMTEGFLTASNTRNIATAEWEAGWRDVEDTEIEAIFTWSRYINRFLNLFGGFDFTGEWDRVNETRGVLGVHYLLPFNVESRLWIDSDGGGRLNMDKEFELTPRLTLVGEAQYDTHDSWEGSAGINYALYKNTTLNALWHSEYHWGFGMKLFF